MEPQEIAKLITEDPNVAGYRTISISDPDEIFRLSQGTHWFSNDYDEAMPVILHYLDAGGDIEFVVDDNGEAIFSRNPRSLGYPNWRDRRDREISDAEVQRML